MAEWFKAAVLKTAFRVTGTGVRIPLPPPCLLSEAPSLILTSFFITEGNMLTLLSDKL